MTARTPNEHIFSPAEYIFFTIISIVLIFCMIMAIREETSVQSIEGVVKSVEFKSFFDDEPKSETKDSEAKTTSIKISIGNNDKTRITFQDGRVIDIKGQIAKPLEENKYYIIKYSYSKYYIDSEEVKK